MKLFDAHNDILTQREDYISYLKLFSVKNIYAILAIFLSENKLSTKDILNLIEPIKKSHLFAFEDISNVSYKDLDIIKTIKPLYCSLTWNNKNILASGCFSKGGITKLGYKYIDKIESFSFVDTSHLNKRSFNDFSKYTKKPIFNSHTNLKKFCHLKRNLTKRQIKTIIKSNGLVCLTGVKEFLGKNSSLESYIKSIYYFYKKYGANNLALASDFMGSAEFPLVYNDYSDFNILYEKLKLKGIPKDDIEKIFYLNLKTFFNI